MLVAMRVESNMNSRMATLIPILTCSLPTGVVGCTNNVVARRFISENQLSKRSSPRYAPPICVLLETPSSFKTSSA